MHARLEIVPRCSILFCRKNVVLRLALWECLCPHGHNLEGTPIHRNRPAFTVFRFACAHPRTLANEVNLLPLE